MWHRSATDGGALLLDGATAFLRQVTLADNSAAGGGAIALESSAAATILQSTIVENEASANGGGLKISSSNVLLQNSLIADNSATTAYPDVDGAVLAASSQSGASPQPDLYEDMRAPCAQVPHKDTKTSSPTVRA